MRERRHYQRGRTYLGGLIAFGNQYCSVECLIRNLSQNGAKLGFEGTVLLPGEFDLTLPQKGETRRARIVWRHHAEAGIVFEPDIGAGAIPIGMARRIKQLEAERATLQARVAELSE